MKGGRNKEEEETVAVAEEGIKKKGKGSGSRIEGIKPEEGKERKNVRR